MSRGVLSKLDIALRYLGNKMFVYGRGQSFPISFLRQSGVELFYFRWWLIQELSYINMVICLNMYFVSLIRVMVLCEVKDCSLGFHCSFISIGTDWLASSKWNCVSEIACTCLIYPKVMVYANCLGFSGLWVLKEVINKGDFLNSSGNWEYQRLVLLLEASTLWRFCMASVLKGGWSHSADFLVSLLWLQRLPEGQTSKTKLKAKSSNRAACKYVHRHVYTCTHTHVFFIV